MNGNDEFDVLLKERFERERGRESVSSEHFVSATMLKIRAERRRATVVRNVLPATVLVALILASPWLIAGATHLNAVLDTILSGTAGYPIAWVLGALALAAVLMSRLRSR